MDSIYLKHYGRWLGGAMILAFILGWMGLLFFGHLILLIPGVIVGTVQTHKALNARIQFGKAILPVLLFSGGYVIFNYLFSMIYYGYLSEIGYMLPIILTEIFMTTLIATSILLAVGMWYTFEKAGQPGWACIVPIYNYIIFCEIAKKPSWWVVMFFIPIANIVFLIMTMNGISKNFGKDEGFTVGLVLLGPIFWGVLGFGDAEYQAEKSIQNDSELLDDSL